MTKHTHKPHTPLAATTPLTILLTLTALILTALTGCGNTTKTTTTATNSAATPTNTTPQTTSTSSTTTPAPVVHTQTSAAPVVERIQLSTPVTHYDGPLPARYTCDGQDTPPPLHWTGIPPGTHELLLEIIKLQPENNKLSYAWAVNGIPPTTTSITNNKLPPGTTIGANYQNKPTYHLCPPKNKNEQYVIALFALLHHHPTKTNFNPDQLHQQAQHDANYQALYITTYKRH